MEEEKENQIQKIIVKKEKSFKTFAVIFLILGIIILIIFAIQNKNIPIKNIIFIGTGIIVFSLLCYFGITFYKKYKKIEILPKNSDKLPEPINSEELKKYIKQAIENDIYKTHITEYLKIVPHSVGNNLIYNFQVKTLYSNQICNIIINAHYPQRTPAVMFGAKFSEILKTINASSTKPSIEPDKEITTVYNPTLGIMSEHIKTTSKKKKKKIEKEKEEDELI